MAKVLILLCHIIMLRDSNLRLCWSTQKLSEKAQSPTVAATRKRMTETTMEVALSWKIM
jgi:hypothetical protein